jgi:hypothetical protein
MIKVHFEHQRLVFNFTASQDLAPKKPRCTISPRIVITLVAIRNKYHLFALSVRMFFASHPFAQVGSIHPITIEESIPRIDGWEAFTSASAKLSMDALLRTRWMSGSRGLLQP